MKKTMLIGAMTVALAMGTMAEAFAGPAQTITGEVGEDLAYSGDYDGIHLRFVGDPAPDGFSPWYQWGSPHVLTESPEDGPVTMSGTIDVTDMAVNGRVGIIGLHDAASLQAGDRGEKAEAGIYLAYTNDMYTVGVTDGDAGGGEFVQRFVTFAPDELTDGILEVDFVVDGTLDPADCVSDDADLDTADGCMSLTVNGQTVTDSYGTIVPTDIVVETEFEFGAYPGWYSGYSDAEGADGVGAVFNLTVSPVVLTSPQTVDDCKNGGFEAFDFKNQGGCVASLQANERAGK